MTATIASEPLVWNAPDRSDSAEPSSLSLAEVVSALSFALDLSTGQPVGHSVRACILAMRIGLECGLSEATLRSLYYGALLKDAGCSSNASMMFHALDSDDLAAKRDVKTTDWTKTRWETVHYAISHVAQGKPFLERMRTLARLAVGQKQHAHRSIKIRCERGATLARLIGLPEQTADAIASLDEHWDGKGHSEGLRGEQIPLLSRITLLAQTLEVFFTAHNPTAAIDVALSRSGTWFDPALVKAAQALASRHALWNDLSGSAAFSLVLKLESGQKLMPHGELSMDAIALAFAQIVDAKSPFTYRHSNGVANAAVAIGRTMGLPRERIVFLRHAALLHDLGKLGVSNTVLEKPAKLDNNEWQSMKRHPFYTWKILNAVKGFRELSEVAASHHEKLDGSGYFRGMKAERLNNEARILVVADIFDALSADRPYREGMPLEKVFGILRKDAGTTLDGDSVEALIQSGVGCDQSFVDLLSIHEAVGQ